MKVRVHLLNLPSPADHERAMRGDGLLVYSPYTQQGAGFWGDAWSKFVKPIASSGLKAAGHSFMKHAQKGNIRDAFKHGAQDGLEAAAKRAQRSVAAARPF